MKVALGFARIAPEPSTIPTPTLFALLSMPSTTIRSFAVPRDSPSGGKEGHREIAIGAIVLNNSCGDSHCTSIPRRIEIP